MLSAIESPPALDDVAIVKEHRVVAVAAENQVVAAMAIDLVSGTAADQDFMGCGAGEVAAGLIVDRDGRYVAGEAAILRLVLERSAEGGIF